MLRNWSGAALALLGVIATIWLAAPGRLTLYVHPRYTLLTVIMAVLTLLVLVLMAAVSVTSAAHEHSDHDHVTRVSAFGRLLVWSKAAVLICTALALLVLPPATLSSSARQNRELVTSGQALDSTKVAALVGADPATFSVKDWAALLSQGGPEAVLGKQVDLSGYVLDRGRGCLLHCTAGGQLLRVDAQLISSCVRPGWRDEIEPGAWIRFRSLCQQPSRDSQESVAIGVGSSPTSRSPTSPMSSDLSKRQDRFGSRRCDIGACVCRGRSHVANTSGSTAAGCADQPGRGCEGAGERLVLRADQTVARLTADQVTVTPRVRLSRPRTGRSDPAFCRQPELCNDLRIVAKVRSATTGASSTLTYSFRTPDGAFYFRTAPIERRRRRPGQIVHHVIGSTERRLCAGSRTSSSTPSPIL